MLARSASGQLVVPIAELPRIENNVITGWRPASVSRADGSQWLVAFTKGELAAAFSESEPTYPLQMSISTAWVVGMLPTSWGIVLNLRTEDMITWNAAGVAKFKKDFLASTPGTVQEGFKGTSSSC
jgi:hypothetical protein